MLPAALKAVEDRNFDTHHGVDPAGIARAIWVNVRAGQINLHQPSLDDVFLAKTGRTLEGAEADEGA